MALRTQDSAVILPNNIWYCKGTQGTKLDLMFLKVGTEVGRKRVVFHGSLIYNQLPNELKQEQFLLNLKTTCDDLNFD